MNGVMLDNRDLTEACLDIMKDRFDATVLAGRVKNIMRRLAFETAEPVVQTPGIIDMPIPYDPVAEAKAKEREARRERNLIERGIGTMCMSTTNHMTSSDGVPSGAETYSFKDGGKVIKQYSGIFVAVDAILQDHQDNDGPLSGIDRRYVGRPRHIETHKEFLALVNEIAENGNDKAFVANSALARTPYAHRFDSAIHFCKQDCFEVCSLGQSQKVVFQKPLTGDLYVAKLTDFGSILRLYENYGFTPRNNRELMVLKEAIVHEVRKAGVDVTNVCNDSMLSAVPLVAGRHSGYHVVKPNDGLLNDGNGKLAWLLVGYDETQDGAVFGKQLHISPNGKVASCTKVPAGLG